MSTRINEILVELQETWGYTLEEQTHIHDLIVEYGRDLLEHEDLQDELENEELIEEL